MCDLRKAFDSVYRDLLWHKLSHFMELKVNFSPSFKACMYEEVLSCVRVNKELVYCQKWNKARMHFIPHVVWALHYNDLAHRINKLDV